MKNNKVWIGIVVIALLLMQGQKEAKKVGQIITTFQENSDVYDCWKFPQEECSKIFDGDFESYTGYMNGSTFVGRLFYNKPNKALSTSRWEVKDNSGRAELTLLPGCWNLYPDKIELQFGFQQTLGVVRWYCFDGQFTQLLKETKPGNQIFEERMIWEVDSSFTYAEFTAEKGVYLNGGVFTDFVSKGNQWITST